MDAKTNDALVSALTALVTQLESSAQVEFQNGSDAVGWALNNTAEAITALLVGVPEPPKDDERRTLTVFSFESWHEDDSAVLWWLFPIAEPPYVGTPLDDEWPFADSDQPDLYWTRLDVPGTTRESAGSTPRGFTPSEKGKATGSAKETSSIGVPEGAAPGAQESELDTLVAEYKHIADNDGEHRIKDLVWLVNELIYEREHRAEE